MRTLAATLAIALFATACSTSSPSTAAAAGAETQLDGWEPLQAASDVAAPWGEAPADDEPDDAGDTGDAGDAEDADDADDSDEQLALVRSALPIDRLDGADVHWHRLLVRAPSDHHAAGLIRPPIA